MHNSKVQLSLTKIIKKMQKINNKSKIPKYQQIINLILGKLKDDVLKKGDILPSLNDLVREYSVSKDTVVKAYKRLKEKNIIGSAHGKSFYLKNEYIDYDKKVLILFDVLQTPYKEALYKGIMENINSRIHLDFYFHNFNPIIFKKILEDNINDYDYFVVMPFPNIVIEEVLKQIDQNKLILLDRVIEYEGKDCSMISQCHDFELERTLNEGIRLINKYSKIILVFPEDKHHPVCIKDAFLRFSKKNKVKSNIIGSVSQAEVAKGEVYLVIEDDDLVKIIKASKEKKLKIGKDVGIISYDDTPLKEIIENGITVISVDFYEMGAKTARQIIQNDKIKILEPTRLITRNSL